MEFVIGILMAKVKLHFFFFNLFRDILCFPTYSDSGNIPSASGYTMELPRDRQEIPLLLNKVKVNVKVAQSCLTFCDPMDYSPQGSSVHGGSPGQKTGVRLPYPSPGALPNSGIEPGPPA